MLWVTPGVVSIPCQDLFYFDEVYFNFQDHLFKVNREQLTGGGAEISAEYIKQYNLYGSSPFILLDFSMPSDFRDGKTQFTLSEGSQLTFSMNNKKLLFVRVSGDVELVSSLFEGASTQQIEIHTSGNVHLEIADGNTVKTITVGGEGELLCSSKTHGEYDPTRTIKFADEKTQFVLASEDLYIKPCDQIDSQSIGNSF